RSPLARKLARDNDIDLAAVTGTGPGGRIVRADVQEAIETGAARRRPAEPEPSALEGTAPPAGLPEPANAGEADGGVRSNAHRRRAGAREGRGGGRRGADQRESADRRAAPHPDDGRADLRAVRDGRGR